MIDTQTDTAVALALQHFTHAAHCGDGGVAIDMDIGGAQHLHLLCGFVAATRQRQ
jgi:hypothetical protein